LLLSPLLFKTVLFHSLLLKALLLKSSGLSNLSLTRSLGVFPSLHFCLSTALLSATFFIDATLLFFLLSTLFVGPATFLFLLGLAPLLHLTLSVGLALGGFGICFLLLRSGVQRLFSSRTRIAASQGASRGRRMQRSGRCLRY
jgi:hypothetical protein